MNRFTLNPPHCPFCSAKLDRATCITEPGQKPNAGDLTICIYCAAPLQFSSELELEPVDVETLELILEPAQMRVMRQLLALRARAERCADK